MSQGIYKIVNKVTGKFYVGSCINFGKRVVRHLSYLRSGKHHSIKLQNSYKKHGEDSFEFIFMAYHDKEDLLIAEKSWIDKLDTFKNGYNMSPTPGSRLGMKASKETREKMSRSMRGKKRTPEQIQRMRDAKPPMSEEQKQKLSIQNRQYKHTPEAREKIIASSTGRKHTESAKKKMSLAQKGRKRSEELKKRFSDMRKGKERNPKSTIRTSRTKMFRANALDICKKGKRAKHYSASLYRERVNGIALT